MTSVRTTLAWTRALVGVVFAVLIAVRMLGPAGFMPSFEADRVTIITCPDFEPAAAASIGHHHGTGAKPHQPCPYASATTFGLPDFAGGAIAVLPVITVAPLPGRGSLFVGANRGHRRPPPRGPPIPT